MMIFGCVVRWLRGQPIWAGNRYDPGDNFLVIAVGSPCTGNIPASSHQYRLLQFGASIYQYLNGQFKGVGRRTFEQ